MRIVWIIKLRQSQRTAAIVAVRAPAVHGVSRVMHPVSGYGEMQREIPDLVRYLPSGSKTIFREFF